MELPDRDRAKDYWLLECARRRGDGDEAVERASRWFSVDDELEEALRAAAEGEWREEELLEAYLEAQKTADGE